MKILLKSKKNVAVMLCPECGTFYSITTDEVCAAVKEVEDKLVCNCPHCYNYNDYSKAEWVEAEEIDAVIQSKKEMLEKAGF